MPDNIEVGVHRYLALERQTWKPGNVGLQKNASHKEFYLSVISTLAKEGRASIHFLETHEGKRHQTHSGWCQGAAPADLTAVTDALVKFSQLAVDLGDRILEMDVNPLKKATFY